MDLKVSEISERLSAHAPQVAAMLLPGGREYGQEWLCGDLTGKPGESLKVTIHSTYAGQWADWATGEKGDMIDLWRMTKGLTPGETLKEVKAFLGIVDPVRQREQKHYSKPPQANTAALSIEGGAMKYLTGTRHLSREIVEALKIEGDPVKKAIVFPSYSPRGDLVNRSYRTLTEPKEVWQDKGCAPSLFGWQALPEEAYKTRRVLLSEGQIDCASWLQWGIPALSVPNGSGCSWVDYEWDNLAPFDTFYLAFDQDKSGEKIANEVMARLGRHRCLLVAMPKKDANACLQSGYTAKDAAEWVQNAKIPMVDKLVTALDLEERVIEELRPKEEAFTLPFLGKQWPSHGLYFRPSEVTVWGGYPGAGKTTMLNFVKSAMLSKGNHIFEASMEMKPEALIAHLMRMFYKEPTEANAREFVAQMGHMMLFADVKGHISQERLFEMMWFSYRRYGAEHFVIDSLMRIDGLDEKFPEQIEFMSKLSEFAHATKGHIHLVAHLRKPTGKDPGQPDMNAVKGSGGIVGNADNVLIVARNPKKDKLIKEGGITPDQRNQMHDTEIIVEKQRASGWLGKFRLKFHPHTQSFSSMA